MRPLLLLDVDGVLFPLGRSVPPGFERHSTPTMEIVASRQHGEWLRELNELFEITWASTWGETANETFGGHFGLPRYEVFEFGELPRAGTRKLKAVAQVVGDRAVAWLDDELYDDAEAWAVERDAPTLLVRTAPYVGLQHTHVEALREFAARFGERQ